MSNLIKLTLALVIAAAAGIGNYAFVKMRTKPVECVRVKKEFQRGTPIDPKTMLESIGIPGDQAKLEKTFILYSNRAVLDGMKAPRTFSSGELITHRDIASTQARWDVLGPFTLLSVGGRIRSADKTYSEGKVGDAITIAVKVDESGQFNANAERLFDILEARTDRSRRNKETEQRIVAIQVYPESSNATDQPGDSGEPGGEEFAPSVDYSEDRLPLQPNERAVIVPLSNIESVPEVLVRGDQIGFVVPHRLR